MLLTYYHKPNGQIDEAVSVVKNIKTRDLQTANVILDFKLQCVQKCTINGEVVPKDWDRMVSYYYQHYANVIERLFVENGHSINVIADTEPIDKNNNN
jgi:hypothetical protein